MDSSASLQDTFPKKDCNSGIFIKDSNFTTLEPNTSENDSVSKNLPISDDSEIKIIKANTISHEQVTNLAVEKKKPKTVDSKSKIMSRAGLSFLPGSKLEAKDFNEKWYSARVVETDWIEREVLIHFDKWSSRFDEWIPMDSSRLRVLQLNAKDIKLKEFSIGEKILATWVDGKKYPAKVNASLGNDKYDVLFDDGYSKILKTSKMTKLVEVPTNKLSEEKIPYVGSKQERRDKKRKHTITELFSTNSKKKIKGDNIKVHKQDLSSDVHNIKYDTNSESFIETQKPSLELAPEFYKNVDQSGRMNKIKRNIFGYNNVNLVDKSSKWANKNIERNSLNPSDQDYATFIGHLRIEIEDSTYKCPKKGCNKNFRKENLLQMHIKHYHPEYSRFLGSTPNVADLAYARTIGESVEDLIPKKSRNPIQPNQIDYQVASAISRNVNSDFGPVEIDNEFENKLSDESVNISLEDSLCQQSNDCSMSPDRLFDIRFKEDKTHTGIKTLLPVRPLSQKTDVEQFQCATLYSDSSKKQCTNNDSTHKKQKISSRDDKCDEVESSVVNKSDIVYHKYNNTLDNSKSVLDNTENNQSKNDLVVINGELIKVEKLRREEIINCTCGITEEDGLMIQCDLCLCWQHGHCNYIEKEKDVPEKYICYICQHSFRQRASKTYFLDQSWIHEGQLPSLRSYDSKCNEKAAILKRSCDLIAGLLKVKDLLHSLRVKMNIAQSKDHPKLYLWAKNWNKIAIPNVKTESVPVMEIVKIEDCTGDYNETQAKEKTELRFSPKRESAQKLIASDTELMKILEEDSLQTEESKPQAKFCTSNIYKDEGQILLDALTKNGLEDQENHSSNKNEVTHQESSKQKCASRYQGSEKVGKSQTFLSENGSKLLQPIIPEPEEPIDPVECKLRLMEHIDHLQTYVDNTLNFIEVQLSALEDLKHIEKQNSNSHIQTKQTILMLINDLNLLRKLADLF